MGVPPAKLHEKPAEANKRGTKSEHTAGFFDPVACRIAMTVGRGSEHRRPRARATYFCEESHNAALSILG
jgi:hypothetical protein